MITLYTWPTPNGKKIQIMLEETGLPYCAIPVDIHKNEQFDPEFLKISPNNKIPAIVDSEGPAIRGKPAPYSLFESGAILVYLAGKTGRFLGRNDRERFDILQWLMFQMGGFGPMLGQAHHFRSFAPEKVPYAIDRYTKEAARLYKVINQRLGESEFLGAREYSIADIATWPWAASHGRQGINLDDYPHVARWFRAIEERPAVQRALKVLAPQ
jgi:GST-like protein